MSEPSRDSYVNEHGVLRNKLGITDFQELQQIEADFTSVRIRMIAAGNGPTRTFDRAHLAALHKQIFGPVYEWAGRMRDERPIVDGTKMNPIETLSKGMTAFANASAITHRLAIATEPLKNRKALSTLHGFANRAGDALAAINQVHPFREGNGRAQRAFIEELGREHGHKVRFEAITRARMIEASVETTQNPSSDAMRHLVLDATDPLRAASLLRTRNLMLNADMQPDDVYIRSARPKEKIEGKFVFNDNQHAQIISRGQLIIIDPKNIDTARAKASRDVNFVAEHTLGTPGPDRTKKRKLR